MDTQVTFKHLSTQAMIWTNSYEVRQNFPGICILDWYICDISKFNMQIHKYVNICICIYKYIIIFIYSICEYSQIVLDFFPEFLHQLSSLSLAVHKVRVSISQWVLGNIQLSNCQLKGLMQYLIDIFFSFFWLPIILNAFWNSYEYVGFFFCTLCVCFLCPLSVIPPPADWGNSLMILSRYWHLSLRHYVYHLLSYHH